MSAIYSHRPTRLTILSTKFGRDALPRHPLSFIQLSAAGTPGPAALAVGLELTSQPNPSPPRS